jgi:transposase
MLRSRSHSTTERLRALAKRDYPETEKLRAVHGVGPVTALQFVLTIGEPGRFAKSRQVGSFLGLQPRRSQSGDRCRQLGITKAGDSSLRQMLAQCSQFILGKFGERLQSPALGTRLDVARGQECKETCRSRRCEETCRFIARAFGKRQTG